MPRRDSRHRSSPTLNTDEEAKYNRLRELAKTTKNKDLRKRYKRQARDYIFLMNNRRCAKDEIDLHDLSVEEAIHLLQERIKREITNNSSGLNVIVGKGEHSKDKIPKIKPAVVEYCRRRGLEVSVGKTRGRLNQGRLYIHLQNSLPTSVKQDKKMETHAPRQPASTRRRSVKKPLKQRISSGPSDNIPSVSGTLCGANVVSAAPPQPVPPVDVRPPAPTPHVQGESPKVPKESSPNWVLWGLVAVVGISLVRKYVKF